MVVGRGEGRTLWKAKGQQRSRLLAKKAASKNAEAF
jgi:hypothetical protein